MLSTRIFFYGLICFYAFLSQPAFSQSNINSENIDILELGVGPAAVTLPDYPGSQHHRNWLLPFPYLNYEGRHFKLNRDEIAWQWNEHGGWHASISLNGLPPVKREDTIFGQQIDTTRDTTLELGPSLIYDLNERWQAQLAARQTLATDFTRVQGLGWRINPRIAYAWPSTHIPSQGTQWEFTLSSLWNNRNYNNYFYQADIPNLANYEAAGGYGGSYFSVKYRRRSGDWLWTGYVRLQSLDHASFADSPLVETKTAVTAGVAAIWLWETDSIKHTVLSMMGRE